MEDDTKTFIFSFIILAFFLLGWASIISVDNYYNEVNMRILDNKVSQLANETMCDNQLDFLEECYDIYDKDKISKCSYKLEYFKIRYMCD